MRYILTALLFIFSTIAYATDEESGDTCEQKLCGGISMYGTSITSDTGTFCAYEDEAVGSMTLYGYGFKHTDGQKCTLLPITFSCEFRAEQILDHDVDVITHALMQELVTTRAHNLSYTDTIKALEQMLKQYVPSINDNQTLALAWLVAQDNRFLGENLKEIKVKLHVIPFLKHAKKDEYRGWSCVDSPSIQFMCGGTLVSAPLKAWEGSVRGQKPWLIDIQSGMDDLGENWEDQMHGWTTQLNNEIVDFSFVDEEDCPEPN